MALNKDGSSRKKNSERQAQPQLFTRQIEPFTGEITIQWISIRKNDCTIHWIGYCYPPFQQVEPGDLPALLQILFIYRPKNSDSICVQRIERLQTTQVLLRDVIKISSCQANDTSRQGIQQLGILFGSIFLLFPYKSRRGSSLQQPGKIPSPQPLMTALLLKMLLS